LILILIFIFFSFQNTDEDVLSISEPTNLTHPGHLGIDEEGKKLKHGFQFEWLIENLEWRDVFLKAGATPKELRAEITQTL